MACTDVPVELGYISPHLAEAMLEVEDMPILKRINVMVGITRSKVILNFGYAAAIATEGYICALVDFAMKSKVGASIELDCPILGLRVLCMFFSQLLGRRRRASANSAVISLEHCENVFPTNCNGLAFKLKTTLGKYWY